MFLTDTNICSYVIKDFNNLVVEKFQFHYLKNELFISSIVQAELLFGVHNKPSLHERVLAFVNNISIMDWDYKAAEHYADISYFMQMNGHVIGVHDMQIAAHARSLNATVITNNIKHYQNIPDLKIENWSQQ